MAESEIAPHKYQDIKQTFKEYIIKKNNVIKTKVTLQLVVFLFTEVRNVTVAQIAVDGHYAYS